MMTMNHWKSFTDIKADKKKVELLKSLDNYLYLLFCSSDMTPVSPHTIKFNSDSSLIETLQGICKIHEADR
jgi:hypothetical protein